MQKIHNSMVDYKRTSVENILAGNTATDDVVSSSTLKGVLDPMIDGFINCQDQVLNINSAVTAGTAISLPSGMQYIVGTNTLEVSYNGTVCHVNENFLEVGTAGAISTSIKLTFDVVAGDQIGFHVSGFGEATEIPAVVHKSGDEIISGVKTFQNNHAGIASQVIVKSTDIVKGTPIIPGRNTGVVFTDSTNNDPDEAGRLASVVYHAPENENSEYYAHLRCNNYYGSGDAVLRVGYDRNNISYSTAPSTSDDRTNSTDIVTRGYMEASEWNWQKTKKNALVQFKPVPESDLEPVVDFMFTETPPASGDKSPSNPSTIIGVTSVGAGLCGKNVYYFSTTGSGNYAQVSVTFASDGTITLNGTCSSAVGQTYQLSNIYPVPIVIPNKTYLLAKIEHLGGSYTLPSGVSVPLTVQVADKQLQINETYFRWLNDNGTDEGSKKQWPYHYAGFVGNYNYPYIVTRASHLNLSGGVTFNNYKIRVQYEYSDTGEYTEYEIPKVSSYTLDLGNTYYGGTLDVATGVMTVTHYYRTLPASLAADPLPSNSNFATGRIWPSNFTDFIEEHGYVPRPANPIVCDKLPTYTGGGYTTDCISLGTYNAANQTSSINIALTRSTLGLGNGDISANDVRTAIASWISSNSPVIVYPLHTPFTVQLTPTQIRSLPALDKYEPRINTVYTDQEAVQVGYQRYANYVDLTTDQTIYGEKVFRRYIRVKDKSFSAGYCVFPYDTYSSRADALDSIAVFDNNSKRLFLIRTTDKDSNGDRSTTIYAMPTSGALNGSTALTIGLLDVDGASIGYAQAPSTPKYEADGTTLRTAGSDIITRDWIPKDTRIVHTTGNETINGVKTFTSEIHLQNTGISINSAPTANRFLNLFFTDSANESLGRFLYYSNSSSNGSRRGCSLDLVDSSKANHVMIAYSMALDGTDGVIGIGTNIFKFCPSVAGCTLGANSTNQRWGQIYSSITTISTSDERVKREISDIPNEVLDAWNDVNWVQFKMADSLERKGESARIHNGMIAQQINSVFKQHNLDVSKYGLFCYDEWEKEDPSYDEDGQEISFGREAGNLYSLRYEEALCMEAAYQRRENSRLKQRVSDLENELATIKEQLAQLLK